MNFFKRTAATAQSQEVTIRVKFAAGASGAVPTDLTGYLLSQGITGMALDATGLYKVTLQDPAQALARGTMQVMQATYDASHGCRGEINAEDVQGANGSPYVQFQCVRNDTGAAVAVTSGDIVLITLELELSPEE